MYLLYDLALAGVQGRIAETNRHKQALPFCEQAMLPTLNHCHLPARASAWTRASQASLKISRPSLPRIYRSTQ